MGSGRNLRIGILCITDHKMISLSLVTVEWYDKKVA